jgi:sugar lactone lactonase YvrE
MWNRFGFFSLFLLFTICTNAQTLDIKEWAVGIANQKINFEYNKPKVNFIGDTQSYIYYPIRGTASFTDNNGKLLFTTDGMIVFNSKGDTVEGGGKNISNNCYFAHLQYNANPNSTVIIPKGNNQYYIFYPAWTDSICEWWFAHQQDTIFGFNEMRYSVVDMNANNGAGKVILKNKLLKRFGYPYINRSNITACKHANGRDWWLVNSSIKEKKYIYKYLVTADTIIPETQIVDNYNNINAADIAGQSCFSKQGNLYAECNNRSPITIYNFDRCTGMLQHYRTIEPTPYKDQVHDKISQWYGVCFSPNERYLYTCDSWYVYQIDLAEWNDAKAIKKVSLLDTSSNFPYYSGLQLTPTGHIYIGYWSGTSFDMHAIMDPDNYDTASHFMFKYITLLWPGVEPPNNPFYELGALAGSPCDTIRVQPNEWVLFPNPARDMVKLKVPTTNKAATVNIIIYNMQGQAVLSQQYVVNLDYEININTKQLANGLYYLKATSGGVGYGAKFLRE